VSTRRRSRWRRVAKWMGLVICVLAVGAWCISLRYMVSWRSNSGRQFIFLAAGCIWFVRSDFDNPRHGSAWSTISNGRWETPEWWFYRGMMYPPLTGFAAPLWLPFLASALPTSILLYRDRRRPQSGHCAQCGYDLTSNTSGICPECGTKVAPAPEAVRE
jgi:4-amino-4-deoxy-L-arabinose transferase-like glycosyltransferase